SSVQRRSASLDWVRVSRVPHCPRYYQSTKTSCAEYAVTYSFASTSQYPSPAFAPLQRRNLQGPGPAQARYPLPTRDQSHTRPPWLVGNPSYASALLSRSRSVHQSSPSRTDDAAPVFDTTKAPTRIFRDSITRLQYLLSTLHERCRHLPCKTRFRSGVN